MCECGKGEEEAIEGVVDWWDGEFGISGDGRQVGPGFVSLCSFASVRHGSTYLVFCLHKFKILSLAPWLRLFFGVPTIAAVRHRSAVSVLGAVPTSDLRWSCLCVAMMTPTLPAIVPLDEPQRHKLILKADMPPAWEDHWVKSIPLVGVYLNLIWEAGRYTTELEDVADFLAEDLKVERKEWVGRKVGMKEKEKGV